MKKIILAFLIIVVFNNCNKVKKENKSEKSKIPVYAWMHHDTNASSEDLKKQFLDLKNKGIDALMYSVGHDTKEYKKAGKAAKEASLDFHAWIPTMVQQTNPKLKPEWYAVNGKGESAFDKPAYVDYYKFLCPSRPETYAFLEQLYSSIADLEEVDGIHLDYIRFPDVILAKGLWEKYGLVMDKEYPQFDYCYCEKCTTDFKVTSGIDIKKEEDPSQIQEWKQFRYNLITNIVNKLADTIHGKNKEISAAVFPGPNSVAKKIVRQEWNKWNLDAFFPMNYNDFYMEDTKWIGEVTKEGVLSIDNKKPIFSGLFICPKPKNKANESDPENHGLLPNELESAIKESMNNGAKGICLFTPDRMTVSHWEILNKVLSE